MQNLLVSSFNFIEIFGNIGKYWYAYVGLLVLLGLFILYSVLKKTNKRNTLTDTQRITYTAIITAMTAVVNMLSQTTTANSVSLVPFICFFAGVFLGAKSGFVVGFIGDLIQCIILPMGAYNPFLAFSNGLMGFIPGFIFDKFNFNAYIKVILSFIIVFIVCSCCLNTFGLWLYYSIGKKTFYAYLIGRLPFQSINMGVNALMCLGSYHILRKVVPKEKFTI